MNNPVMNRDDCDSGSSRTAAFSGCHRLELSWPLGE